MASDDPRRIPRTPLVRPTAYFRRRTRPSLGVAVAIMLGEGLAFGAILWLFVQELLSGIEMSPSVANEVQSRLFGAVILFVIMVFVGWLIIAAILHAFVWFAGGDRGFATTLAIVGETEFVAVLTVPLTGVFMLWLASSAPSDPQALEAYVRQAVANGTPALFAIGLLGTVWRAIVSGAGIATVHGLPREKAYAATFIVGILGFLLGLVS